MNGSRAVLGALVLLAGGTLAYYILSGGNLPFSSGSATSTGSSTQSGTSDKQTPSSVTASTGGMKQPETGLHPTRGAF